MEQPSGWGLKTWNGAGLERAIQAMEEAMQAKQSQLPDLVGLSKT